MTAALIGSLVVDLETPRAKERKATLPWPAEPCLVSASIRSLEDPLCRLEPLANQRIRLDLVQHREHVQAASNTSIAVTKQPDPNASGSPPHAQLRSRKSYCRVLCGRTDENFFEALSLDSDGLDLMWLPHGSHMPYQPSKGWLNPV